MSRHSIQSVFLWSGRSSLQRNESGLRKPRLQCMCIVHFNLNKCWFNVNYNYYVLHIYKNVDFICREKIKLKQEWKTMVDCFLQIPTKILCSNLFKNKNEVVMYAHCVKLFMIYNQKVELIAKNYKILESNTEHNDWWPFHVIVFQKKIKTQT